MIEYFIFGLGFYVGLSVKDPSSFAGAGIAGVLRGLFFGVLLWPVGIVVAVLAAMEDGR